MNKKRFIIGSLAVFVFIFIFDWLFHGVFLKGLYKQTAELWRSEEEMNFPLMMFAQLFLALVFSYIVIKGYEAKGIGEGVRYGFLIGLLFIPSLLMSFAVQPLTVEVVVYWILGTLIEMTGAGAILAAVYQREDLKHSRR